MAGGFAMSHQRLIQLVAVPLLLAATLPLTSCREDCNSACVTTFKNWVRDGAVGSVPAGAGAYCVVHPDSPFCPNN